jgi:hypothetical protein
MACQAGDKWEGDVADSESTDDDQAPQARVSLMREVAEQMDAIEADFGDSFKIGKVVTVVEVIKPDESVELRVRANQLPWVAYGMLEFAKKILEHMDGE